jgi:hypothetical protein
MRQKTNETNETSVEKRRRQLHPPPYVGGVAHRHADAVVGASFPRSFRSFRSFFAAWLQRPLTTFVRHVGAIFGGTPPPTACRARFGFFKTTNLHAPPALPLHNGPCRLSCLHHPTERAQARWCSARMLEPSRSARMLEPSRSARMLEPLRSARMLEPLVRRACSPAASVKKARAPGVTPDLQHDSYPDRPGSNEAAQGGARAARAAR